MHTAPTSVSSGIVVGAGLILFGSALALAAPMPFYVIKNWSKNLEEGARFVVFVGGIFALGGIIDELHHGRKILAFAALGLLALAEVLLLAPVVARIITGHQQTVIDPSGEDANQHQDGAVIAHRRADQIEQVEPNAEHGGVGGDAPESHSEADVPR